MTLEDRLEQLANRTPPGDASQVLAAARTRAENRHHSPNRPLFAAAAAAVVVVALLGATLALRGSGEGAVTVAGPDDTSGDEAAQPDAVNWPPRSGQDCPGLHSETVWLGTVAPADYGPPEAGGEQRYQETVTNTGDETCSIVFALCPAPGALFTTDGQRIRENLVACPAMAQPPEELRPGQSRAEPWSITLAAPPGDYELRVPQRDGTVAALPITLNDAIPACPEEAVELRPEPEYEQYTTSGRETNPQLLFGVTAEGRCTVRFARTTLELRPADSPDDKPAEFVDDQRRWYAATRGAGVLFEPAFGPIDLPPAQYEGTITVELDNGGIFTHRARLLVGGLDYEVSGVLQQVGGPAGAQPAPVPGVISVVDPEDDTVYATIETDDDGSFAMMLPAGRYKLTGRTPHYQNGDEACVAPDVVTVVDRGISHITVVCHRR